MKNILFKVQKGTTEWDHISFTVEYKIVYKEIVLGKKWEYRT